MKIRPKFWMYFPTALLCVVHHKNNLSNSLMKKYILSLFFLLAGLSLSAQHATKARKAIQQVLDTQVKAWNAGDLTQFMDGYWHDDSLLFVGSRGLTYGWQPTLDNYKKGYPDVAAMGQLDFTILRIDVLSRHRAFVIGKWHLARKAGDVGGHFTLLWRKIGGRWVIVADHSS